MAENGLSSHFLQNFLYTEEPFAVIQGRIHTLSRTNGHFNGSDTFHFRGRKFALEESEEVSQLEKALFTTRCTEIEALMSEYICTRFLDKIEQNKSELKKKQNLYSSMRDATIERFIMIDVFNAYNHEDRKDEDTKVEVSTFDNIPTLDQKPGVHDLRSKENSLDPLIGSYGFVVLGRKCYTLYQNGSQRNEEKGYVVFGNSVLDLKPWIPLESLCDSYTQKLLEKINQTAEKHGAQFAQILEQMKKEKQQLDNAINKRKKSQKTQDQRGEIGFRKIKNSQYEVSVTLSPYIIEKDGEYFAFGTTKIGVIVKAKHDGIMINDAPKVLSEFQLHPFVWPNRNICFGELHWINDRGVQFNYWYDLSNRRAIARKIAIVMREGKLTLEKGYVGTGFIPVRDIHNCQCKIADDKTTAEQYARTHGISKERIIKNE